MIREERSTKNSKVNTYLLYESRYISSKEYSQSLVNESTPPKKIQGTGTYQYAIDWMYFDLGNTEQTLFLHNC